MTNKPFETTAHQTTDLVGAQRFLTDVRSAVFRGEADRPHVIVLIGEGGIGKTRQLTLALRRASHVFGKDSVAASDVVDLYHTVNHTDLGLAGNIAEALTPPTARFAQFEREKNKYARTLLTGDAKQIAQQRADTLGAFTDNMQSLARKQTVVIALDTAERVAYAESAEGANGDGHSWQWLKKQLMIWDGNVVVLIAGRKAVTALRDALQAELGDNVQTVDIARFDEAESLEYFDAAATTAEQTGRPELAQRIRELPSQLKRATFEWSAGVPILHSLIIDILVLSRGIPQILYQPPGAALSEDERRGKLEASIVKHLQQVPALGTTLLTLGKAPRGLNADLLARLLDISETDAANRLTSAKGLSFVKVRESDDRVFLHDEMYAMLARHAYQPADREAAFMILDAYYDQRLEENRTAIAKVYAPIEIEGKLEADWQPLPDLLAERTTLITDRLYYRLRASPGDGFIYYYEQTREATLNRDTRLDAELEAEAKTFWEELGGVSADPSLPLDQLEGMFVMRDAVRLGTEGKYEEGLAKLAEMRASDRERRVIARDPSTNAVMLAYEAYWNAELGQRDNLRAADDAIARAIHIADETVARLAPIRDVDAGQAVRYWRAQAVRGFAYRTLGYLRWIQVRLKDSVDAYRVAAEIWRRTGILVELARTLREMGFAQSEMGNPKAGLSSLEEALALHKQLVARAPLAYTLNAYGKVQLQSGNFESAIHYSTEALSLFRMAAHQRGIGLALIALAEATRRHAGKQYANNPERRERLLHLAAEHADEAAGIFEGSPGKDEERLRQVEAQIEIGCAYRDLARLRYESPSAAGVARLSSHSADAFNKAAELAKDTNIYRYFDALINRGWLGFYIADDAVYEAADADVVKAIEAHAAAYMITETNKPNPAILERPSLFLQLGKWKVLHGHKAYRQWLNEKDDRLLRQAVADYALGLEYDSMYADNSVGLDQALRQVDERLRKHQDKLDVVRSAVEATEAQYDLDPPSRLRQFLVDRAMWLEA